MTDPTPEPPLSEAAKLALDLAAIAGALLIVIGAALIYRPAGFIVAGGFLIAGAWLAARKG